jgi:VWFA-related protein
VAASNGKEKRGNPMRAPISGRGLAALFALLLAPSVGALASPPQNTTSPQQQKPPEYTLKVKVPAVNVDVVVVDNNGNPIPGLKKENFRVFDNNVPQTITNFTPSEAPLTTVLLLEFSQRGYEYFAYIGKYWASDFVNHLLPQDWIALVTYDMRPHILVDFTRNKAEVQSAISGLYYPGFNEANLFDAVLDVLDRLKDVQGKKSIVIVGSGLDTFSKHNLDDVLRRLKETEVTIFAVGVDRPLRNWFEAHGVIGGAAEMNYLQAENQLSTFARMTGGQAWFPQFDGEIPGIFQQIADSLRNQYSLAYVPTDVPEDGKFHKIKVQLVGANGKPAVLINQKGKKVKYRILAREGYVAPKAPSGP